MLTTLLESRMRADHALPVVDQPVDEAGAAVAVALQLVHAARDGGGQRGLGAEKKAETPGRPGSTARASQGAVGHRSGELVGDRKCAHLARDRRRAR